MFLLNLTVLYLIPMLISYTVISNMDDIEDDLIFLPFVPVINFMAVFVMIIGVGMLIVRYLFLKLIDKVSGTQGFLLNLTRYFKFKFVRHLFAWIHKIAEYHT